MFSKSVLILLIAGASLAMNRQVYKIVLTQKGYTQFLQYDVDAPVLREFTFCTWLRIYDLEGDQTIFSYVVNGNNRIMKLWVDSGGRNLKISITGRTTNTPVHILKDVWRHLCLSYQSDYGAWAIYLDAQLLTCDNSLNLNNFVLPSGGSIIVGYGTDDNGKPSGLEGEIFGTSMLLASTIQRNNSAFKNYLQLNSFERIKTKNKGKNIKYVVLNELRTDEKNINDNEIATIMPVSNKIKKNLIPSHNKHRLNDDAVGLGAIPRGFSITDVPFEDDNVNNLGNKLLANKFKAIKKGKFYSEDLDSKTLESPTISEFETPPPPTKDFSFQTQAIDKFPRASSFYNTEEEVSRFARKNISGKITEALLEIETPPTPQKDNKVYGQWSSAAFANSVLDYLKSKNFEPRSRKPTTIQLPKISDSYPYATELKLSKLQPPAWFQRTYISERMKQFKKRDVRDAPQINVQILEDDLRSIIQKMHAATKPIDVQIINRGLSQHSEAQRLYRNTDINKTDTNTNDNVNVTQGFEGAVNKETATTFVNKLYQKLGDYDGSNIMSILPLLKTLGNIFKNSLEAETVPEERSNDMYTKSLSGNEWHNVKSFKNNYTPRIYNLNTNDGSDIDQKLAEDNNPFVRLRYKHNKPALGNEDRLITKTREHAMNIANKSSLNQELISILKYDQEILASQVKTDNKENPSPFLKSTANSNHKGKKDNFNKHVKLGNTLNEREFIGNDENLKAKSFVGGDENIPDINKYRSDLDKENTLVPSSLGLKTCRSLDLYSTMLYVHPDQSILATHIVSPVRKKKFAIDFILQNYNKCSLQGSVYENHFLLLIDWRKTPVRLFGGAMPKKTTDLCGLF